MEDHQVEAALERRLFRIFFKEYRAGPFKRGARSADEDVVADGRVDLRAIRHGASGDRSPERGDANHLRDGF